MPTKNFHTRVKSGFARIYNIIGFFEWNPEDYLAAGLGLGAAGLAVGQRPVQAHIPRSIYDITRPIFNAEAQRRKILTLKDKCKTNLIGNGFHSMAYDLLFFCFRRIKNCG